MKCLLFLLTVCILNEFIYGLNQASESETQEEEDPDTTDEENDEENDEESEEASGVGFTNNFIGPFNIPSIPLGKKLTAKETADAPFNEQILGDISDLFATNRHYFQPHEYKDFSRRFVLQYPYSDAKQEEENLMPIKAPPEVVLAVAKESALLEASKQVNPSEHIMTDKNVLRNGDYWNGVWQEDVNPKSQLRSKYLKKKKLNFIKAKIMQGSDLYELISKLKRISPRLLYVINKESKN